MGASSMERDDMQVHGDANTEMVESILPDTEQRDGEMRRKPRPFGMVAAALWTLYTMYAPIIIAVVMLWLSRSLPFLYIHEGMSLSPLIAIASLLACLLAVFIARKVHGIEVNLRQGLSGGTIVSVIGTAVIMYACSAFIAPFAARLFPQSAMKYARAVVPESSESWMLTCVQTVIIAPLFEEFIFRGIILEKLLQRGYTSGMSVSVATVLFAIGHQSIVQSIAALACGVCLGVLYVKRRSLSACIMAHGLYNGIVFVLMYRLMHMLS